MPNKWNPFAFVLIVVIAMALTVGSIVANKEPELTFECHFEKMTGLFVVEERELEKTDTMIKVKTGRNNAHARGIMHKAKMIKY